MLRESGAKPGPLPAFECLVGLTPTPNLKRLVRQCLPMKSKYRRALGNRKGAVPPIDLGGTAPYLRCGGVSP